MQEKWGNVTSTVRLQLKLVFHVISILLSKTIVNLVSFPLWRPVDSMHEHDFTFSLAKWPTFLSALWSKCQSVTTSFETYYRDLQEGEDQCRPYQMTKYNYIFASWNQHVTIPTESQSIQTLTNLKNIDSFYTVLKVIIFFYTLLCKSQPWI